MPYSNKAGRVREGDPLTPRELEILSLLAAGHSSADIAAQLGIVSVTVKSHLTNIYRKIGAKNRVQAARYYFEHHVAPQGDAA